MPASIVRIVLATVVLFGAGSLAPAHELLVGRNAANQVVMHLVGGPVYDLPLSPFPGIVGFAAADPGFVANGDDNPGEDIFIMPPTSDIEFVLISADPHIAVWNDTGSAPMNIGQVYHIGSGIFHNHPVWQSPDGTPNTVYALAIQLRDRTGQLSDSVVYSIGFRPVPEPGVAALLLAGAAVAARRR